jgi:molecular chaperone GrpE (heat shock protein)
MPIIVNNTLLTHITVYGIINTMLKKIRDIITNAVVYVFSKIARFLYRDELKQMEKYQKILKAEKLKANGVDINELKAQIAEIDPQYVQIIDKYMQKQNEILVLFISFLDSMKNADKAELEAYANLWATTTDGLTRTLGHTFAQSSVEDVHAAIISLRNDLEQVLNKQGSGTPGGFTYNGPIGEA